MGVFVLGAADCKFVSFMFGRHSMSGGEPVQLKFRDFVSVPRKCPHVDNLNRPQIQELPTLFVPPTICIR